MLRATTTAVRAVGLVAIVATGCSTNSTNFDRDDRQGGEASQWQLFEQKKTAGGVEQAEAILILVLGGGKKITTFSEAFWSKQKNIRILCEDSSLALKTERRTVISVDVGEPIQPEGRLTKQSDGVGRYDGKFSVRLAFDQGPLTPERWNESSLDWIASPKDGPPTRLISPYPAKLLKELRRADMFFFEYTPFRKPKTQVGYPVSGLSAHLSTVARVCGVTM